ncbi:MAG: hypothetical protein HZB92_00730 [Euryarchaeota archaeon]|nr:hypothetical protein [Euryarchaeota archaeon]
MAKKRRETDDEDDEEEFKIPEFDKEAYLREEVRDSKAILVSCLLAVPLGVVAVALTIYVHFTAGLLVGLAGFGLMKPVWALAKIDLTGFDWKKWLFNIGSYFFTFLVVWILLLNPPVMDVSPPVIHSVQVAPFAIGDPLEGVNWTNVPGPNLPVSMTNGTGWVVRAVVSDNVRLGKDPVIYVGSLSTPPITMTYHAASGTWYYASPDARPLGQYITLMAWDMDSRETRYEFSLTSG